MTEEKYTGVDVSATREARAAMVDQTWWKPEAGKGNRWGDNPIRVMPPHPALGKKLYWGVPMHFSIGPNQVHTPCPRRAFQQACPICAAGFALRNQGQEEAGDDLLPTWVGYMSVVPIDDKGDPIGDNPKVRTWSASGGIIDDLIDILEEQGDFTNLEKGFDINVRRKGPGGKKGTDYQTTAKTEPSAFPMPELAEGVPDLSLISPFNKTTEELAALLTSAGSGSDPMLPEGKEAIEAESRQVEKPKGGGFPPPPGEEEEPDATPSDTQRTEAQNALKDAVKGDNE